MTYCTDPIIAHLRAAAEKLRDTRAEFYASHARDRLNCAMERCAYLAADSAMVDMMDTAGPGTDVVVLAMLDRLAAAERESGRLGARCDSLADSLAREERLSAYQRARVVEHISRAAAAEARATRLKAALQKARDRLDPFAETDALMNLIDAALLEEPT